MVDTQSILKGKYPAKLHCKKLVAYLKATLKEQCPTTIYLQGQSTRMQEDNDEPQPFRQRRHFFYLSGCALPDCHLTYHVSTNSLTLFIPPLDPSSVIWSGLPLSPVQALKIYDIDSCLTTDALTSHLQSPPEGEHAILAHTGRGTMDPASTGFKHVTTKDLHSALDNCRITKDDYEVALLRHANHVSTAAHVAVLRSLPKVKNECELEAVFRARCLAMGAKEQAYHGIFGSGENAATLHYQANDQPLEGRQNLLVDAAAEWECYCADVTRTMPLSSKGFSKESEGIYKIVERMQDASFGMLKAGVQWEDVHLRAHEVAIDGLLGLGILKGEKKGLLERRTSVAFFPHGLGHYLGMDTHDTGGNPNHEDQDTMFKYLRVRGRLPEGSVVTVEPGIYFCEFIIKPYINDEKYKGDIDQSVLEKYWAVAGVRIEDDVLITKDGYENLTTAPKKIEGMMNIINGKD